MKRLFLTITRFFVLHVKLSKLLVLFSFAKIIYSNKVASKENCINLQCPHGFILIYATNAKKYRNYSRLDMDTWPCVCIQYTTSPLKWQCLRGNLNEESQCEIIHRRPPTRSCETGYFLVQSWCYKYRLQLSYCGDAHTEESKTAKPMLTCEKHEVLDESNDMCVSKSTWSKIPSCVGGIVIVDKSRLVCQTQHVIKPELASGQYVPLQKAELTIEKLNVVNDVALVETIK